MRVGRAFEGNLRNSGLGREEGEDRQGREGSSPEVWAHHGGLSGSRILGGKLGDLRSAS